MCVRKMKDFVRARIFQQFPVKKKKKNGKNGKNDNWTAQEILALE